MARAFPIPGLVFEEDGLPTLEYLNLIFELGTTDGEFTGRIYYKSRPLEWFANPRLWKRWNTRYAGTEACQKTPRGYIKASVEGRVISVHRVVFKMVHRCLCPPEIDHDNGVTDDNSISNLKPADHAANMKNKKKYRNNTSGRVGVSWNKANSKWIAYISGFGRFICLGNFVKFEDAVEARRKAEIEHQYSKRHGT